MADFEGGAPGAGGGDGQSEGGGAPSIADTLAEIVRTRGDKLGDGTPPTVEEPTEDVPPPTAGDGQAEPGGDRAGEPPARQEDSPPPPAGAARRPVDLTQPPTSWKPEVRATWAALPEPVRAEIHRREEDSARGFAEIKPLVETGKRFSEAMRPFAQEFQTYGVDPVQLFSSLANAHRVLSLGTPQEKSQMLAQISRDYHIPFPTGQGPDASFGEPGWVDPQVKALQEEVERLKSAHQTEQQRVAEERRAKVAREVESFAKDPANPYFEEVAPEIARLARADPSLSLKDLYDQACWLVPGVREKLVAAEADKARKAAEEAERKRAEEAAKSRGGPPRSTSKPATATGRLGTIDDTMRETLAKIEARSK